MIAFSTTCKGRADHIKQTLPLNLRDNRNPNSKFVLLDYNSQDGLAEYLESEHQHDIDSGRLVVYSYSAPGPFHVAHAKNMAHRLAISEGADILVTVDADNFTGPGFDEFILARFRESGIFLCPNHAHIQTLPHGPERPCRGFAGRLAIRAQDFIKAGGYNEAYDTWRGEDIDLNARMVRMGYTMRYIDNEYLGTIPHNANIRFKEYRHARQYESPGAWKIPGTETSTVVNYGRFGCGSVYRNFCMDDVVDLKPLPTRVFGIGLHKTATTSLHKAFQILGYDSLHWGVGEVPVIWHEMNHGGRSHALERYYAACDLPIPLLYRQLDAVYPGSKFVLTVRDESKWVDSVRRLWSRDYNPTRWMWEVYPISNTLHQALYGQTEFSAEVMLNAYRRHNREVQDYFRHRPEDLAVMNMEQDSWPELCGFLDEKVPSMPYPMEYVSRKRGRRESHCQPVQGSY